MCGIAGLLAARAIPDGLLEAMAATIRHRGPDDGGIWNDGDTGIGLAHRRLSIVDLSPHGAQPMASNDGRWHLSFNGEIYNHRELRRELEAAGKGPAGGWRGHSDTETLVEGIAVWGLEKTLSRASGMFAFALWDRRSRTLQLVRDRFGEKPLYYGWAGRDFVFASELKAIARHPDFVGEIDRESLALYAARLCVPAPRSIYRGLFKLEPGCILTLERGTTPQIDPPREGEIGVGAGAGASDGARLTRYWSYADVVEAGLADPIADQAEALAQLDRVLGQAIADQAVADVPVGAFLSGGVDSSTVVALYQKHSSAGVRTFSIGFAEQGYNEADDARAVARHLGTVHREQIVTAEDAREVIPLLPRMYDEPFADASQIPTYLVSRFARGEVTVALTGDGGDELFAGYNRHFRAPALWKQLDRVPAPLRRTLGSALGQLPSSLWARASDLLPGERQPHFGAKVQKALRVAGTARGFDEVYLSFLDEWGTERSPVRGGGSAVAHGFDRILAAAPADPTARMMYCDALSYLPDDILAKVDRASMAVSLETRVPFLDHRVAELAARIPVALKVQGGRGKHILRQLLYRHVPPALIDRPKSGFGVPIGEWLKGPLRPWAEELLDPRRMGEEGWFDPAIVSRRWQDHLAGTRDSAPAIWGVLMFQAWLRDGAGRR